MSIFDGCLGEMYVAIVSELSHIDLELPGACKARMLCV